VGAILQIKLTKKLQFVCQIRADSAMGVVGGGVASLSLILLALSGVKVYQVAPSPARTHWAAGIAIPAPRSGAPLCV
jgi:hypothetical protein